MSTPALATIVSQLEDELFYAVLDVAMDIDQALTVQSSGPVRIGAIRDAVRFPILYPVQSVESTYRYADLRRMALSLLEKQSVIDTPDYRKYGITGWESNVYFNVIDRAQFSQLIEALKLERERRNPVTKPVETQSATVRLLAIAESFHRVAVLLRTRRTGREPLLIMDEYDVQYVMRALLETQFEDVRPEDWIPNYAGGATRVDFFVKKESMFVETKMMRDGLTDHKLGDELIIDIEHYKQRADCKSLLCFVYDPEHRLKNPRALENDLTKQHGSLTVTVIVRPK